MNTLRRVFSIPASESQLTVALSLSLVAMAALLWGILWQADVIDYQRQVIKFLWNYH